MATAAGIQMMECRLYEEGERAHFMTRRFDRPADGGKVHCATLFGMAHKAYSTPGAHSHSYEEYVEVIEQLDMPPASKLEAFRRMAFNVLGCNRDDHVKNFGFMMDDAGQWSLAPAYDVTYAHNPLPGKWTATQQMSVMGKREHITGDDLIALGRQCSVATRPKLQSAIDQVVQALELWPDFAEKAGVSDEQVEQIGRAISDQIKP